MSNYKILTWEYREEWNNYLSKLPMEQQDIYFTPEYYKLYEDYGDGKAMCFVFEKDGGIALYPFLINCINDLGYELDQKYYDIQGAYGYNGIVTNTRDTSFLKGFSDSWLKYCQSLNIVTEFIRFNPVIENHDLCLWCHPIDILDNVLIRLTNYSDIWNHSYDRNVRNAVRKGNEYRFTFEAYYGSLITNELYDKFINLYIQTMIRNQADKYYMFNKSYFIKLRELLMDQMLIVFMLDGDEPVSADLYLHNRLTMYGVLSGTKKDYYRYKVNTILRDKTIRFAIDNGFRYYSIGGGLNRYDSIYKYKKSFSVNTVSIFYIGKAVHNKEIYNLLIKQWKESYPTKVAQYGNRLQCYRYIYDMEI